LCEVCMDVCPDEAIKIEDDWALNRLF
jgi:NAD-dependent dihydropyrimidine dehydrogenase PreA subunit